MLQTRASLLIFFGLALVMGLYLCLRAVQVPLVFDEATSFLLYQKTARYWPGQGFWSANNHYLNSALSGWAYHSLGSARWVLRLPNLLAFVIFCLYLYRLLRPLAESFYFYSTLLALFGLHYAMEFFAYSRGYGLSFAGMIAALYYFRAWLWGQKTKALYGLLAVVPLMLLANLNLLPLAGLMAGLSIVPLWRKKNNTWYRALLSLGLLAPLAGGAWLAEQLSRRGELYYGESGGLWQGSAQSLREAIFYGPAWLYKLWLGSFLLALALAGALLLRYEWRQKNFSFGTSLILFLGLILLFYESAHRLLGILYPADRTFLYLLFTGVLGLGFAAQKLSTIDRRAYLLCLPTGFIPLLFFFKANLSYSNAPGWRSEQYPDRFYSRLAEAEPLTSVGGYYLREANWQYLQNHCGRAVSYFQSQRHTNRLLDYAVVQKSEAPSYGSLYHTVDSSAGGDVLMLKRRHAPAWQRLPRQHLDPAAYLPEYFTLYKSKTTGWQQARALDLDLRLRSEWPLSRAEIAFSGTDSSGKEIFWHSLRLEHYFSPHTDTLHLRSRIVLDQLPPELEEMLVFVWNPNDEPLHFLGGTSQWMVLPPP